MKTTVYAVRDEKGRRVSYRYRDWREARDIARALSVRHKEQFSVYRTSQDLPAAGRRLTR